MGLASRLVWSREGGPSTISYNEIADSFRTTKTEAAGDYTIVFYDYKNGSGLDADYVVVKKVDNQYWLAPNQYISRFTDDPFPGLSKEDSARLIAAVEEWEK